MTPWNVAHQAPLFTGFSRQEYWRGLPCPPPGDVPNPGLPIAGRFFTVWATREAQNTGMGSLSLLQRNFPTQKSNQGLLHCRQILYQQSYQGSPSLSVVNCNHNDEIPLPPIQMVKISNTDNTKYQGECGTPGAHTHCWWECKMVQPFWRTLWHVLTKLHLP